MKVSNGARRLMALTLATSIAVPVTSPAFAASLKVGDRAETYLRSVIEATKTDKPVMKLSGQTLKLKTGVNADPFLTAGIDEKELSEEKIGAETPPSKWEESTPSGEIGSADSGRETTDPAISGELQETIPVDTSESTSGESNTDTPNEDKGTIPEDEKGELPEDDGKGDLPLTEEENTEDEGQTDGLPLPDQPAQPDSGGKTEETAPPLEAVPLADPEFEGFLEDEVQLLSARADPIDNVYRYWVGYGVQVADLTSQSLTEYDRKFRIELSALTKEMIENGQTLEYGQTLFYYDIPYIEEENITTSFCVFPSADMLGRVPDRQFAGWYLYRRSTAATMSDSVWSWYYGDAQELDMVPIKVQPYTSEDGWEYEEHKDKGDAWDGGASYKEYGYRTMTEMKEAGESEKFDVPVSFVGRWVLSDESRAAVDNGATLSAKGTPLTLYRSDIDGVSADGLETLDTGFDRDVTQYWLRVGADVDTVDLDLNAYEIFYDYNESPTGKESPVQVSVAFRGAETPYDIDSHEILPKPTNPTGLTNIPSNSVDDPAHSNWKVNGIRIEPSVGTDSLYNDITVTITPPSGDTAKTTTYIFHVQRLTEPTMSQNPGNTPFGMIDRDTSLQWGNSATEIATNKQAAKAYFKEHYQFSSNSQLYPHDDQNNRGTIFRNRYSPKAWEVYGTNVDMDSEAIVVYQNSAFLDPGITVTDTEGKKITIGGSDYIVERSLQLRKADKLSTAGVGDKVGDSCWYKDGKLVESKAWETLSQPGGTDQIDLRGLYVLPGVYTLEYRYTDPLSGKTYGSDGANFVTEAGKDGAQAFRRTVVVLPIPGDVDMDGFVTSADAVALDKSLQITRPSGAETDTVTFNGKDLSSDATAALFAYRVGNTNHNDSMEKSSDDGNDDVTRLAALPHPQLISVANASDSDYYYIPLPTGDDTTQEARKPLSLAAEGDSGLKLELVYLGKEGGTRQPDGYTDSPAGPWATNIDSTTGIVLEDTFWVGVRLTGGELDEALKKGVDTFTLGLTYDARYLEPATVLSEENWSVIGDEDAASTRWKRMMQLYNLVGQSETVWGTSSYGLTTASGKDLTFTMDTSKAITPLEANAEWNTELTSLVFSVSLLDGRTAADLDLGEDESVWLFAVPFTLISHPVGQESAQLVELSAGMSDFSLVLSDGTAAAYHNTRKSIFGDSTVNLKTALAYTNAGPAIPLGEDKSEFYYIFNDDAGGSSADDIVYATPFVAAYKWKIDEDGNRVMVSERPNLPYQGTPRGLPDWLSYDGANMRLSGTPTEASTAAKPYFDFTIGGEHFRLVVEKAPLHYWADNQRSYYGQEEFRGKDNSGYTFHYATEDIMFIEQEWAADSNGKIAVDGLGENLGALLNDPAYHAPRFTAVEGEGQAAKPVTKETCAADQAYAIVSGFGDGLKAESSNYEFIYTPERAGGNQGLTILRRPFLITQIAEGTNVNDNATDAEGKRYMIYSDRTDGVVTNVHAKLGDGGTGFSVQLVDKLDNDPEGFYDGLPLTANGYTGGVLLPDDSLEILYRAELLQTEEDMANVDSGVGHFTLHGPEEKRTASISNISVVGGSNAANYYLVSSDPRVNREAAGVVGTVTRRNVRSFHIIQTPPLVYQYGDQLSRSNDLRFNIVKDGIIEEGTYPYNEETTFAQHGITVTWATKEEKEAGKIGSLEYHTNQTFTVDYNGRYLCLSTEIADETAESGKKLLTAYWEEPLRVTQRTLTLTATPVRRYYGESNGELRFTYNSAQLSVADYERLIEHFGRSSDESARDGEELNWLLADSVSEEEAEQPLVGKQDYKAPTLSAWEIAAKDITERGSRLQATTPYTGAVNAVMIEGASCNNYAFEYVYTDRTGNTTRQPGWGASEFRIERRPIVVEALRQTGNTDTLAAVYADTKQIYIERQQLTMDDVILDLPEHTTTTSSYFPRSGVSGNIAPTVPIGYADGAMPVVNGDKLSFTYTATMVSQDGEDYVKWTDFSKGHFNMEGAGEDGTKRYSVQVSNLQLVSGEDNASNNYVLVFKNNTSAVQALPARYSPVAGVEPGVRADKFYYVPTIVDGENTRPGTGEVHLRPIQSIEIISTGKLDYTYGEGYFPNQPGGPDNREMRIAIHYAQGENAPYENYDGNVTSGTLSFRISHYDEGRPVTSFDDRSLVIYWLQGEDSEAARATAVAKDQRLSLLQELSVSPYDGAHLFVTGKRGNQDVVFSAATKETLHVARRMLTLTAADMQRCYGEENGAFSFTFDMTQLAERDREKLEGKGLTGESGGAALAALDFAYEPPSITTTANARSNVINGGQGGYPITVSGGSLDNYRLEYESGTLHIYPRMLQITGFDSSETDPIYTIFANTDRREFTTNVTNARVSTAARPNHISGSVTLPVTADKGGILTGDTLTFKVTVSFPSALTDGTQTVRVVNAELVSGAAVGNYELEQTGEGAAITNRDAIGVVQRRSIADIVIVSQPSEGDLSYTYGDSLNLSELVVRIHYNRMEGESETGQYRDVPFLGTDQFAENGLYIHYYDSDRIPDASGWAALNTNNSRTYRTAATGDHVTIAPTHDTQGGNEFSANGKHLIVSAQLEGQSAAPPVILAHTIQVSPRPLTFTLNAEGKTYDGTTQAAGTLTLTNVYRQTGYVDAYNRAGVTDQIYPVTGAEYEKGWESLAGSFNSYLTTHGGYVFSTGTYDRSGELDLDENNNYAIQWVSGYDTEKTGVLHFAFADANVAYAQEPAHDSYGALRAKPVHVTGLKLAGPDAANYTIAGIAFGETGSITADNVGGIPLEQYAQGALPQAVIYKANRAKLPTDVLPRVEVDPHTNVVRVVYDQSESVIEKGEKDADIHFEYVLQYEKAEGDTVTLQRWAGNDGNALWDDSRYFGGVAVSMELPEGYVPREEDLSAGSGNETVSKGQLYAWAEEDPGFTLEDTVYPGGYSLYTTQRDALPRDTVFLPLVRAAETHNYNPSPALSAVVGYTPEKYQELLDREADLAQASSADFAEAQEALARTTAEIRALVEEAVQTAVLAAQSEKAALEASGEGSGSSAGAEAPGILQGPAVKTYLQRIETISVKELKSADAQSTDAAFAVPVLEAVWFTDVLEYPRKAVLDAVLRNSNPTRYYDYGWDSKLNTKLNFEDEATPISFAGDLWIDFTQSQEGQEETGAWVNQDHAARIYVNTTAPSSGGSSGRVERITIDSGDIVALVGDEPRTLTVTIEPAESQNTGVKWTSSDPSVVRVSQGGVITFLKVGTAVITATAGGVSASITVAVVESWLDRYPDSIFDFNKLEAFFPLGEDMLFHPEWEMSRGETALLLVRLYRENPNWSRSGPKDFPDLTGEEDYAEAARLLGSLGVMIGVEDGSFDGDRPITRAEFITLLVRMLGVPIPDTKGEPHAFLDTGEEGTWAYAEIDAMANSRAGVLLGVGDGCFAPGRNITRAEAVTFLNRLLRFQKPAAEEIKIPLDVGEDHWAREAVLRAVNRGDPLFETEEKKKP